MSSERFNFLVGISVHQSLILTCDNVGHVLMSPLWCNPHTIVEALAVNSVDLYQDLFAPSPPTWWSVSFVGASSCF